MKTAIADPVSDLMPAWFVCVLAPAPAILVAKSGAAGLMYFFVACAALVAYAFRHKALVESAECEKPPRLWRWRMSSSAIALLAAWLIFSALSMRLPGQHGQVAALLGLLLLVPCLCIVPYMVLVTRQPFAAVVFSITLAVLVKLSGCAIAVLVYGWDADEQGETSMPWLHPNLLVWCFYIGTTLLSAACYFLGARKSQSSLSLDQPLEA